MMNGVIKILFLAANPTDTGPLRLDREIRAVDQALRQAEFRDNFEIKQHWAVQVTDLQSYLLRHKPDIVHFSGHGSRSSEIILEDSSGNKHPVSVRALSQLFFVLKDNIRCVVLNACYSEGQAQAIAQHIDCVIGMSKAIGDQAAIGFAAAFYQALGYGRDVKTAFELGCVQIDLKNLNEQDTPKLMATSGKPEELLFVSAADSLATGIEVGKQVSRGATSETTELSSRTSAVPKNFFVPADIAEFVGREKEIEELTYLLSNVSSQKKDSIPLVCNIAGMGGIGKSTLAIHVSHQLKHLFPDGVLWANLREEEPFDVLAKFAGAYGSDLRRVRDLATRVAHLRSTLTGKSVLLILDNAQKFADVRPLLPNWPTVATIITSRKRLVGLRSEKVVRLRVLSKVEAKDLLKQLVGIERVEAEPEMAKKICHFLGYLPLGIQVTGMRLSTKPRWTLEKLFQRLLDYKRGLGELAMDDSPENNVRVAFALSYKELQLEIKRLFCTLGLFAGPDFDAQAVAALHKIDVDDAEDFLEKLVDLTLVQEGRPGRYQLHDLLRVFARERLNEEMSDKDIHAVRLCFLHYYVNFADKYREALGKLELENKNMLNALEFAETISDTQSIINLTASLSWFWLVRGYWGKRNTKTEPKQAYDWMVYALDSCSQLGNIFLAQRAMLSQNLATIETWRGEYVQASNYLKDHLTAIEQAEDATLAAESCRILGRITVNLGDYQQARQWLEKSEQKFMVANDKLGLGRTYKQLGIMALQQRDWNKAGEFFQKSIGLVEEINDTVEIGRVLNELGRLEVRLGNYQEARGYLKRSYEYRKKADDKAGQGRTLQALGDLERDLNNFEQAKTYYEQGLEIQRQLNERAGIILSCRAIALLEEKQSNPARALEQIKEAEDIAMETNFALLSQIVQDRDRIEKQL